MDTLSIDADRKLFEMASSIGRNPLSWKGWYCLFIELKQADDELYKECISWSKSIIESYLGDMEGRAYFCDNQTIHVLCKTNHYTILEQAGQQINSLVNLESSIDIGFTIYDLAEEGFWYAQNVLEETDNVLSMPSTARSKFEDMRFSETDHPEKPMQNIQSAPKVLLVEDDPVARWMVRNAVKGQCEFITAPTANQAYSLFSSFQPDVVFLDINLPDGNARAVLEWIMKNDPGACVVMFSGNDSLDNIARALDDGASGFIAKPFLKEQLLHYINIQTGSA